MIARRIIAISIAAAFLVFGLMRLGLGSALLCQVSGGCEIAALEELTQEISGFIETKGDRQLIPFTPFSYIFYIWLMGLVLSLGAAGSLANKSFGLPLIGFYLFLHTAIFVNFLTINRKVAYLIIGVIFLIILQWAKRSAVKNETSSDGNTS